MSKNKRDYVTPKVGTLAIATEDIIRTSPATTSNEFAGFNVDWIAGTGTNNDGN